MHTYPHKIENGEGEVLTFFGVDTHACQACSIDHSDISPLLESYTYGLRLDALFSNCISLLIFGDHLRHRPVD
jgi:hypothetical protein